MGKRTRWAAAVAVVALIGAGVAYATIPGAGGVYTACKLNATGTIRLIDPSGPSTSLLSRCTSLETQITWSQTGPAGASPTVAQLAAGDSHCPAGGAAITDAAGNTAYVCSGARGADGKSFDGSFTSPSGQFSLNVSDAGVHIAGGGSSIELSSTGAVTIVAANDLTETVGHDATIAVGTNESVTVGNSRTESVGKDDTIVVHGDRVQRVDGNESATIGKDRSEQVAGNETVAIGSNKTESDGLDYNHTVGANFSLNGGGTGLIKTGATLDIKGSIVNIN